MHPTVGRFGKNAFEILSRLPRHGVGARITRITWGEDSFWTVTETKLSSDGAHGKASGIFTWKGEQEDQSRAIRGPLKKMWALVGGTHSIRRIESPAANKLRGEIDN